MVLKLAAITPNMILEINMVLAETAFALQTIGSIIGGYGKKKAAKRAYRAAKKNIRQRSGALQEDLLLETQTLIGDILGNVGATGMRMGSSSVGSVTENEQDKYGMRRERILQWEDSAIKEARQSRRTSIKEADLGMVLNVGEAALGYGTAPAKYKGFGSNPTAYDPTTSFTYQSGISKKSPYELR